MSVVLIIKKYSSSQLVMNLRITFGGMWRWRRVAVARVFALVVRSRAMLLLLYSRVGKNRDTRRGSPAGAGAGRTADHLAVLFSQKVLAVRSANDIYRPVSSCFYFCMPVISLPLSKSFVKCCPFNLILYADGFFVL